MDKQEVPRGLLGEPGARNLMALPQNQDYIYFCFPDSWHDAVFVLSQPHHVSTQGILRGFAVRESHFLSHYFVSCLS